MNGSPALGPMNQYPGMRKASLADRSRATYIALELVERADDSPIRDGASHSFLHP